MIYMNLLCKGLSVFFKESIKFITMAFFKTKLKGCLKKIDYVITDQFSKNWKPYQKIKQDD